MIDVHCHILPDLDDGAAAMEEAVAMARKFHEQGYEGVIATPHVMANTNFDCKTETINAGVRALSEALKEEEIPLTIYPGAEYYLDRKLPEMARFHYPLSTLADSHYILIELPMMFWPPYLDYSIWPDANDPPELYRLLPYLRPVIAHPERNHKVIKDYRCLHKLKNSGYFFQVNLESIVGLSGKRIVKLMKKMAKEGLIDLVGTDGHRSEGLDKIFPDWRRKVEKVLGESGMELIMEENPRRVINNEMIEREV